MSIRKLMFVGVVAGLAIVSGCGRLSPIPTISFSVEKLTAATVRVEAPLGWVRYEWHFGDGSVAEGQQAEHAYDAPGDYAIDLKALSVDGNYAFAHRIVSVHRDFHVGTAEGVSSDYSSIQPAVDAAEPGDMILIHGEHIANVVIDKAIALRGPCTLSSVTARPVLHVRADGVTLENLSFEWAGDEATAGGALRLEAAAIEVVGCSFDDHSGSSGGAVYAIESDALFSDCTFSDNRADIDGGAVYCEGDRAFPTFRRCTFSDNRADAGGALAVRATTQVTLDASPLRVEDCLFERNRARSPQAGGAIHVGVSCRTVLDGNTFIANGVLEVVYE